jgi:branched-chain amino acid transport system ATP-binding protein
VRSRRPDRRDQRDQRDQPDRRGQPYQTDQADQAPAAGDDGGLQALRVRGLTVRYGTVEAVKGIDLDVEAGETVALLGANGAGKTSTLRAISGLVPSKGQVIVDGRDIGRQSADARARTGLVHVPEGRRLFATLTAEENLLIGMTARAGRTPMFSLSDIYDLFPPLTGLRRRGGWSLSGGEQQMVAIGRALLSAPRLLLLDEPSLGLAPLVVTAVYDALKSIAPVVAMVLVEQNAGLALSVCHRAYVLAVGRVTLSGAGEQLGDRERLLESYLARDTQGADGAVDPAVSVT